jgi:NADH-quinone oxidoreductase subunit D
MIDPVTGEMVLSMGPQHPSTHGVIRLILRTDGEVVTSAVPDIGYLHRSIEKIAESVGYSGFTPYTDRVDYVSAMHANAAYALTVEKMAGIEVPRRAEFIRVIAQEFNRIISHIIAIGTHALDLGAYTPFVYLLRERERINDLLEGLCGGRLTYNFIWVGGVSHDLPEGFVEKSIEYLDHFERVIDEFDRLASHNKIFVERLAKIGAIDAKSALHYGLVGPNLRASGVSSDIRRDEPYSVYPEIEFDVPIGQGWYGSVGDSFDRYYIRVLEMRESVRILRQALRMVPEGDIRGRVPRKIRPPIGEGIGRVESSRGNLMVYILSDATEYPFRLKIRTGSFNAMTVIERFMPGMFIADVVSFFASLDVVAPEIDR